MSMKVKYRGKEYTNFVLKYNEGVMEIVEIFKEGSLYSSLPRETIYTSTKKVEFIGNFIAINN